MKANYQKNKSYLMKKFFKLLLMLVPLLFYAQWGIAQVAVINELQPDPGNGEGGIGEFMELYCPPGAPCNVGCNIIATDDNNIFTIPSGTSIPAGGYLVIYNSTGTNNGMTQTSGDFNGWVTTIGPNVLGLDLSTCSTCTASGLAYDNASPATNNGAGQRIVMFDPTGAIVDAFAYCSQAGADVASGLYTDDPDGCGVGVAGDLAGAQPEGLAYTYGTCGGFAIPNTNAGCPPPVAGVTLPARGNAAYEVYGGCITGCSSSLVRQTDGSLTWIEDNSPTPGKPNDSATADVIATATSGTCTPVNFALKNYNIRNHESDAFVDNVTVCSGNAFSVAFTAHIENFVDINNGVANTATSSSSGNTTVNSTRTATSNPAPTISAPSATGVRTVTQTTTFNAAAMTAGTFTLTFAMRESTKGTNASSGGECYYKYTVNVTVTDLTPPTAPAPPASVCYNGIGTVTLPFAATPPAAPAGSTIEWFDAASGGSSLGTGNTLNVTGFTPTGPYPQTVTRYAETVSADGCCRSVSRTAVNVIINQAPTITAASNSPVCVGDNILVTSTPTNTVGTPTFTWDSPTTAGFSALEDPAALVATAALGGTYSVTVTNGGNTCAATASTVVVVNPLPVITPSSNSPVCVGANLDLNSTVTSGTSPYDVSWSGPNSYAIDGSNPPAFAATTAAAGAYDVTVTDVNGCSNTGTTAVVVNAVPTFTATVRCTDGGGADANQDEYYIEINGLTAGTTYDIALAGATLGDGVATVDGGLTAAGLTGKTTYILGPLAHATAPVTITVTNTASATCPATAQINAILCGYMVIAGTDNTQDDLHVSGYFCSSPATTGTDPGTPGILSQAVASVVSSGTVVTSQYVYVLFNDAGATVGALDGTDVVLATDLAGLFPNRPNGTYHVRAFMVPLADVAAFTAAVSGATNTAVTAAAAPYCTGDCGAATYVINCCDAEAGTITNADITSCELLPALSFSTTVTGNKVPDTAYGYAYLLVDAAGNVAQVSTTGAFDLSTLDVTAVTTFKVYGMSYRLSDIASIPGATTALSDLIGDPVAAIIADASQLPTGTLFCGELTDGAFDITINPTPVVTITGTTSYCGTAGPATPLTATGGGTYAWSTGATTAAITPDVSAVGSTTYTVTVTAATGGCQTTASVTVWVNPLVNVCQGSNIVPLTAGCNVTAPYAQVFLLTDETGVILQIDNVTNDCTASFPTTALTVGTTYHVYALNYDTTFPPVVNFSTGINVSEIGNTTMGCYNAATFLNSYMCYTIVAKPAATLTIPAVCIGEPLVLTATVTTTTTSPYDYAWLPNSANNALDQATPYSVTPTLAATAADDVDYTVTVTDANGCTATATANPVINALPTADIIGTTAYCGTTPAPSPITATGGGTYLWDTGAATAAITPTAGLGSTTYTVTVTATNGCTATASTMVCVNPILDVCAGTPIDVNAAGCELGNVLLPDGITFATYNQVFFLTDDAGLIVAVDAAHDDCVATFPTTALTPGAIYHVYALNYDILASPGLTFTVGDNISTIPGMMLGCYNKESFLCDYLCYKIAPLPTLAVVTPIEVCEGATLNFSTTPSAGTSPYAFAWTEPATGGTLTTATSEDPTIAGAVVADSGTYAVTVTDAKGCTAANSIVATVNPLPTADAGTDDDLCLGGAAVQIGTAAVAGNTYLWSPTAGLSDAAIANPTAAPAATTTYTVTVTTTATGCTAADAVVVTVNPLPLANAGTDDDLCLGGAAVQIGTAAVAGNTYLWSPTAGLSDAAIANPTAAPAATTTYTVTVTTTATGCTATDAVEVTVNPLPTADAGTDDDLCLGGAAVQIGTTAVAGNTYLWSPTAGLSDALIANPTAAPAITTTYTVTVTNAAGCTAADAVLVTVNPLPVVALTLGDDAACVSETAFALSGGTPTGGTYSGTGVSAGSFDPATAGVGSHTITYTYTDANGCTNTATDVLTVNPLPVVALTLADDAACINEAAFALSGGTPTGGTYSGTGVTGVSFDPATAGVGSHTITYTYTDGNGCVNTATDVITVSAAPVVSATANASTCVGSPLTITATLTTPSTPNYTYNWDLAPDMVGTIATAYTATVTNSATLADAVLYTVTVTDANGCTAISSVTPTVAVCCPTLAAAPANVTIVNSTCGAGCTVSGGTISAPAGLPCPTGSHIQYSTDGGNTWTSIVPTYGAGVSVQTRCECDLDANVVSPASSVVSTNPGVCTPPVITAIVPTPVLCFGGATGTINVTASGGTGTLTYNWGDGVTTEDRTGLVAGTYNVTVSDANNCTAVASATITQPASAVAVAVTSTTDVLCFGASTGAINITANGGTGTLNYDWADLAGTSNGEDRTGLAAGTYNVTVTDANGCTAATNAVIAQPATGLTAAITSTTNVLCFGDATGAINITANGGTGTLSYDWGGGITTEDRTGLVAGTYTVTVSDASGCATTASATITQPATGLTAAITSTTNVLCFGGATGTINVTASGGTGALSYNWGGGVASEDRTGLVAGTYTVTVSDANNCTAVASATITQPATAVTAAITSTTNVLCFGSATGAIDITASGGTGFYTYDWADITGTSNNEDRTGLAAGTYNVTITDSNGCTAATNAVITQPATGIVVALTLGDNAACASEIAVPLTGGTPAGGTYSGTGVVGSTFYPIIAGAGAYTITYSYTDANGCSGSATATMTVNALPVVALVLADDAACVSEAAFALSGGSPAGGTYSGTGVTAGNFDPATAGVGTHTITYSYTDVNGCNATATDLITVSAQPNPPVLAAATYCMGVVATSLDVTVPGATYLWSNGATTASITPLTNAAATTTYTVTVTIGSCTATRSATITVNNCNTASIGDFVWNDTNGDGIQDVGEAGIGGVTVTLTYPDGTTASTTTNPDGSYSFTGLPPGSYVVTVGTGPAGTTLSTPATDNVTLTQGQVYTDADFGFTPLGSIGDFVWSDLNGDGIQDAGETGIGGITVTLTYPDGTTATTTTNPDGSYSFTGLPEGNYTVTVGAGPADTNLSTAGTDNVVLGAGENYTDADFGFTPLGSIGDFVWSDLNGDGIQDAGETGINGIVVTLTLPDGSTITTTTANDPVTGLPGYYLFDDLVAGSYVVTVGAGPAGTTLSTTGTYSVALGPDQDYLTADFGFEPTGTIGNYVWSDLSGDGQQNDGAAFGLNGVTVVLYADANGDGTPDGAAVATTTTANDASGNPGYYQFTDVPAGSYVIQFVAPSGYGYTTTQNGGAISSSVNTSNTDSNIANTTTGYTGTITLGVAETINTVDAGLVLLSVCEANAGDIPQVELCQGTYPLTSPAGWTPDPVFGGTYGPAPTPAADYSFQYFITNDVPAPHTIQVAIAVNTLPTTAQINALTAGTYRLYRVSWKSGGADSGTLQDASGGTVGVGDNVETLGTSAIVDCMDLTYTYITIRPTPALTVSSNSPVCIGDALNLTATQTNASANPVSYAWSGPSAYSASVQTPTIFNAQLSNSGTYNVTATTGFGCTAVASLSATVNTPPAVNAGLDQVTCSGTGITIGSAAVAGNSYAWSPSAGLSSTAIANPTANPSATTLYTVTVTSAAGCTASDNVLVTVNVVPVPVVSNNGPLCDTRDIILMASGGSTYAWSGPNGFTSTEQNPVVLSTSPLFPGPGSWVYTVTVSNGNCTATASTTVVVNDSPDITVSASAPLCAGSTLALTSTYSNATGNDVYQWSGPNGFSSSLPSPTIANVTAQNAGTYTLLVANQYGCTSAATVIVSVNAAPNASISSGTTCSGGLANLSLWVPNAGLGATYAWSGTGVGTGNNQTVNGLSAGSQTYSVTVTNGAGCTASSTTTIAVPSCFVCNAQAGTVQVNNGCINEPITATVTGNTTGSGFTTQFIVANSAGTIVYVGSSPIPAQPVGAYTVYSYNYSSAPTPAPAVGLAVAPYAFGTVSGGCYDVSDSGAAMTIYSGSPVLVSLQNIEEGNTGGISPFYYNIDEVLVEGGSIPYNFNWDNNGYVRYDIQYGDHDGDGIEDAFITIYYADNANWACTITDDVTCGGTGELIFTNVPGATTNPILDIDNYVITPESGSSSNGAITIYVTGGTPCAAPNSYTYQWAGPTTWTGAAAASGGGGATETITGLPWGWYSVTVTDCSGQTTEGWYWVPRSRRGRSKVEDATMNLSAMPNPFSNFTTIEFQTAQDGVATVEVYAVDGKRVATLYNDLVVADELYSVQLSADNLPAGVYTVVLSTDKGERSTYKVLLTK
jgi:hypothetical protein